MRVVARWSVVLAICSAVVFAAAQTAWHHAGARRLADSPSAGTDAPGASSGFTSEATPQESSYIGPGTAIVGSTVIKAVASSPSFVTNRTPNRVGSASAHALRASRLSPHLRSIPLLI